MLKIVYENVQAFIRVLSLRELVDALGRLLHIFSESVIHTMLFTYHIGNFARPIFGPFLIVI